MLLLFPVALNSLRSRARGLGLHDPAPIVDHDLRVPSVVTNPTLGVEQIIWSDIPMTIQGSSQFGSVPFNPPIRPWPTIFPHLKSK
jgi:hypothetical protein